MTTKTSIAGVPLDSYVFNASGPNDVTFEELQIIGKSGTAAITTKTCTIEPRKGNEEPRYVRTELGSINSMGLPNLGYKEYLKLLPKLKEYKKPIVVSMAGLSPDEIPVLVSAFQDSEADLIELNLSCPNLKGKPQIAYDFEATDAILKSVTKNLKKPLGLKLPPYLDPVHWDMAAAIFKKYPISFLACINSVGNTLIIDPKTEKPLIKPKGGFGGLGGDYVKPVALANVRAFSERLGDKMSIIGVGGVKSGMDAFEFLLCGADAVQIGTQFEKEGPKAFSRINDELAAILVQKGYKTVSEAKSKLRVL